MVLIGCLLQNGEPCFFPVDPVTYFFRIAGSRTFTFFILHINTPGLILRVLAGDDAFQFNILGAFYAKACAVLF